MTTTRTGNSSDVIPVIIVESHQHVLEHIHDVLRKQKLVGKPWRMIHFDAHPDLACPGSSGGSSIPAISCWLPRQEYDILPSEEVDENGDNGSIDASDDGEDGSKNNSKKNLYELLDDTSSGIAEWILPLVVAANLSAVEWIKPSQSQCQQLPLGAKQYNVGVSTTPSEESISSFMDLSNSATIKVDWNHPYYWDDDCVVPTKDLVLAQTLELQVVELSDNDDFNLLKQEATAAAAAAATTTMWSLDICLDYFLCLNPYMSDIDQINPQITMEFLSLIETLQLYQKYYDEDDDGDGDLTATAGEEEGKKSQLRNNYLSDLALFQTLLKEYLTASATTPATTTLNESKSTSSLPLPCQHLLLDDILSKLVHISKRKEGYQHLVNLKDLVVASSKKNKIIQLVIEAVPYWNMPHFYTINFIANNNQEVETMIEKSIGRMKQYLVYKIQKDSLPPPFLISICRSSDDGFTPPGFVNQIQNNVLSMLHSLYCSSSNNESNSCGGPEQDSNCCDETIGNNYDDHYHHCCSTNEEKCTQKALEYCCSCRCRMHITRDYGEWEGSTIY